jgi:hypothetical protein
MKAKNEGGNIYTKYDKNPFITGLMKLYFPYKHEFLHNQTFTLIKVS